MAQGGHGPLAGMTQSPDPAAGAGAEPPPPVAQGGHGPLAGITQSPEPAAGVEPLPPPPVAQGGQGPLAGMTQSPVPESATGALPPPVAQGGQGPLSGITQSPAAGGVVPPVAQGGQGPLSGMTQPVSLVCACAVCSESPPSASISRKIVSVSSLDCRSITLIRNFRPNCSLTLPADQFILAAILAVFGYGCSQLVNVLCKHHSK